MTIAAGTKLGRYEIRSKIGEGGMGEVYLARDTKLDRRVALKVLPANVAAHQDPMRRFVQEAKAASALNHPNIITIHEIDQTDSGHFIATEFIDGETLRNHMRNAPMKLVPVLDVATQIASALSAAHAAGIVHRDMKPENVMLRRDGIVKVLDFGLAKLTEQVPLESVDQEASTRALVNTYPGVVMGTAIYMSPEQARGMTVDARTDIFSLGVVVYEMVAGRLPFEGSNTNEILASILSDKEALPLARYAREVPAELERIVEKALRRDREQRYQTMKDLLLDLQSLKHRLEFQAELARSTPPQIDPMKAVTSGEQMPAETVRQPAPQDTSSAQYAVREIKRHKTAAVIAMAALVALAATGYFYFGWGNKPVGGGSEINSIAILPFVNVNANPETEYLSDGLTDSLINSLSQAPNLKVIARSSVFSYKGKETDPQAVGRELKVQGVITGRITQRGDNLSISVELTDARDKSHIWGEQYNRKLADVFAVQEEIAKEISEKMRLKLTGPERQQLAKRPTGNLRAFQYYSQGRSYYGRRTREDLLAAIRYYEKAIEEDRNYALAYAGLADAYGALGARGYIAPIEGRRKQEEAARTALALDDNLAEAHEAFGLPNIVFAPYNFSQGDRELRRAMELSPSLALAHQYLGHSLMEQGRLDEGLAEYLKARELDPLSSIIARNVATAYHAKRDYGRALELLRQANELGPAFTSPGEIGVYIRNGLFKETLAELDEAKRERPGDPLLIYNTGMIYSAQGKRSEALQIIRELEAMSGTNLSQAQYLARIYATLNEKDLAFGWLERGLAVGAIGGINKDDPLWDPIRSDPHFADLLRRMGIPQ